MWTTDLEVSKQLKEIGVRQESEFWWIYNPDKDIYEIALSNWSDGSGYSAFTLSELPEVFKQIGEIKGWEEDGDCSNWEHYNRDVYCPDCCVYDEWLGHYLEVCNLYATKGEEEANNYILEVIKK